MLVVVAGDAFRSAPDGTQVGDMLDGHVVEIVVGEFEDEEALRKWLVTRLMAEARAAGWGQN